MKKVVALMTLIGMMSAMFGVPNANAAPLVLVSDAVSSHVVSEVSDHEIVFTTPTGVHGPSETISISFSSYDLSLITAGDIQFSHGPTTGSEIAEIIAGTASAGVWGVAVIGSQVTLTPPTDAGANEITANHIVRIRIGLNAGGTNQIVNPSVASNYQGIVNGGFGDTGSFGLAVVANAQVLVTAEVRGSTAGGHGPPADTAPPVIVNVVATSTSPTSAIIQWITDEQSTSDVNYGQTNAYASGTVSDASLSYQHSINLIDLQPCTTYLFEVRSTDGYGNQGVSSGYSFKTVCDTVAPVITNVRAEQIQDSQVVILWSTNEPATSRVEYGIGNSFDLSSEAFGYVTIHSLPISGLVPNTVYTYRVVSRDISGNTTVSPSYQFVTTHDTTPPTNVMFTATPGDGLIVLQWSNPIESDSAGVRIIRRTDRYPLGPGDGDLVYAGTLTAITDSGLQNGITYYYGAYAYDTAGNYSSGALASAVPQAGIIPPELPPEIPPGTTTTPPIVTPPPVTPGETTSTPPIIPGEPTPGAKIEFEFYGSNGTLPLVANDQGIISTRGNAGITVRVPVSSMDGVPRYVVVIVGEFIIQLQLNRAQGYYEGTFSIPPNATMLIKGQSLFIDGRVAEKRFVFHGNANGSVVQSPGFGMGMIPVPGAEVYLYREELGTWVLWNGSPYGQSNPQITSSNGAYLFEVPVGRYYAEVRKEGYETRKTDPVQVTGNVFNQRIDLIYIPKTLRELLASASSTGVFSKIGIIAGSIGDQLMYQAKKLRALFNNPDVQDVNTQIIAPSALIISAFNAVTAGSVFQLLTYLQYVFTQPFLLIWRRKRERYGVVYNSLTKRPIDLCIVRLVHDDTGIVVQTRVTDRQGRYVFHVKTGSYRLEILKPKYVFPSELITGKKSDDEYLDIYDGGIVRLKEDGSIALNIPVDPVIKMQTPRRVRARKVFRRVQHGIAVTSILASIAGLIVTPTVPMALGVVSQFVIYSMFKRLMVPGQPKRWGFVYDSHSLKPIANAVVRLYDQKYRRLLESQITDSKGQYGFLVGKNVYSISVEAKGYETSSIEKIDLMKKEDSEVDIVVSLKKGSPMSRGKSPLVR